MFVKLNFFSCCMEWTVTSQLFAQSGILVYFWLLLPLKFLSFHKVLLEGPSYCIYCIRHRRQKTAPRLSKQLVFLCFLKVVDLIKQAGKFSMKNFILSSLYLQ